jgi:alpha-glucosidase
MAVGEVSTRDLARLTKYYGDDDELHMPFNFHFLVQPWEAERFRAIVERWERMLPPHAWPDYTLSNHDRPRAASRYGPHRARLAAMLLLTLRGTPFIYYGEEIGMTDVPIPHSRVVDVAGRDPCRTPMQWDDTRNAGFSTASPWLPMAPDAERVNVAAQRNDRSSLFSFYRRLLRFRRASNALRRGSYRSLRAPRGVYAFERVAGDERLRVALNFTSAARKVSLANERGELLISSDDGREGIDARAIGLGPDEGVVVRT